MAEAKTPTPLGVELTIPLEGRPVPEAANWFHCTRVNNEYQLLAGYLDLTAIHEAVQSGKAGNRPSPINVEVTHRFAISLGTLKMLRAVIHEVIGTADEEPKP